MDVLNDYFYLGIINKIHGNNGEVTTFLDVDDPSRYRELEMVFLKRNGEVIPYFIEKINILNNKAVIAFEGIDSIDKARELVKSEMYLPLSILPPLEGNKFYYHEVEGFTVVDEKHGDLGKLQTVLDYPNQAVLQLFVNDKEVLIPVSDDIITKVDRNSKTIFVTTPDGLLDIYLNNP